MDRIDFKSAGAVRKTKRFTAKQLEYLRDFFTEEEIAEMVQGKKDCPIVLPED